MINIFQTKKREEVSAKHCISFTCILFIFYFLVLISPIKCHQIFRISLSLSLFLSWNDVANMNLFVPSFSMRRARDDAGTAADKSSWYLALFEKSEGRGRLSIPFSNNSHFSPSYVFNRSSYNIYSMNIAPLFWSNNTKHSYIQFVNLSSSLSRTISPWFEALADEINDYQTSFRESKI